MTALILLKGWNDLQIELWKRVECYPDYDISTKGRVRSRRSNKMAKKEPVLLNPFSDAKGYLSVVLTADGRKKARKVHQLVMNAFLPNDRPNVVTIPNHLNNVPSDNRLVNLERATYSENVLYAFNIGTLEYGENHSSSRLTTEDVLAVRADPSALKNRHKWAEKLHCSHHNIVMIVKRKNWRHI